ncbi:hypothetical protein BKA57DRAFT_216318 [Linnemannia elongata]|nr:hypothetical protein BKA57DRAFT_216318 [Linnemannia elongata]
MLCHIQTRLIHAHALSYPTLFLSHRPSQLFFASFFVLTFPSLSSSLSLLVVILCHLDQQSLPICPSFHFSVCPSLLPLLPLLPLLHPDSLSLVRVSKPGVPTKTNIIAIQYITQNGERARADRRQHTNQTVLRENKRDTKTTFLFNNHPDRENERAAKPTPTNQSALSQ